VSKIAARAAAAQISKPTSGAASRPADFPGGRLRQVWKSKLLTSLCEALRPNRHDEVALWQTPKVSWIEARLFRVRGRLVIVTVACPSRGAFASAPALFSLVPFIGLPFAVFLLGRTLFAYKPPPMYTVVAPLKLSNTSKLRRRLSLETP
jgi:hypothetical protein